MVTMDDRPRLTEAEKKQNHIQSGTCYSLEEEQPTTPLDTRIEISRFHANSIYLQLRTTGYIISNLDSLLTNTFPWHLNLLPERKDQQPRWHNYTEHKRRTQIRTGLEAVSKIVPGCENLQRSEGVLLHKLVEHMAFHMEERKKMIEELEALGEEVDPKMKEWVSFFPLFFFHLLCSFLPLTCVCGQVRTGEASGLKLTVFLLSVITSDPSKTWNIITRTRLARTTDSRVISPRTERRGCRIRGRRRRNRHPSSSRAGSNKGNGRTRMLDTRGMASEADNVPRVWKLTLEMWAVDRIMDGIKKHSARKKRIQEIQRQGRRRQQKRNHEEAHQEERYQGEVVRTSCWCNAAHQPQRGFWGERIKYIPFVLLQKNH